MLRGMLFRLKVSVPATIDQLVDREVVRDVADLYALEVEPLSKLERMGVPSARNLVHQIEQSKTVPAEKVLFGLGIFHVGEDCRRAAH